MPLRVKKFLHGRDASSGDIIVRSESVVLHRWFTGVNSVSDSGLISENVVKVLYVNAEQHSKFIGVVALDISNVRVFLSTSSIQRIFSACRERVKLDC